MADVLSQEVPRPSRWASSSTAAARPSSPRTSSRPTTRRSPTSRTRKARGSSRCSSRRAPTIRPSAANRAAWEVLVDVGQAVPHRLQRRRPDHGGRPTVVLRERVPGTGRSAPHDDRGRRALPAGGPGPGARRGGGRIRQEGARVMARNPADRFRLMAGKSPEEAKFVWTGGPIEVAERTWFQSAFSGVTGFETDDGIVLVDTGMVLFAPTLAERLRERTAAPIHTAVYTHGHVDHAFGLGSFLVPGQDTPRVIGQAAMPARFERYSRTPGHNRRGQQPAVRGHRRSGERPGRQRRALRGTRVPTRHALRRPDDHRGRRGDLRAARRPRRDRRPHLGVLPRSRRALPR